MSDATIRLGLIGDNITRSQSPRLHVAAGRLCGLDVTYERLIPADRGEDFETVFDRCLSEGFRGINITYPYKERVVPLLDMPDPAIAAIGACNTVVFDWVPPSGYNTDYTGFVSAFREAFPDATAGTVAMAGAGGVGKAVAFGLAALGCKRLLIFDRDRAKAEALSSSLEAAAVEMPVELVPSIEEAVVAADGLVNCTPVGMVGYAGTAIPKALIGRQRWAFDAVYTPVETEFLSDARAAGLSIISGYELFFHQGVDAFRHFTGTEVDAAALRAVLAGPEPEARISA
ncbi:shikimate dehydrogenase family protein [Sinorhizobium alkalisoli]|uniref:shikimate dehydrogenase (NADP(+)) n=1 Tax=Sinorhizobium alkalisoli TaxID=1752398 RepID=A0A1E3V4I7_9HYPH|nr:shikimate dehydrogenase [Sinorhizobium alkalisoli]MCG5481328.1 shikimate dehydrogenase [Sinorhizobium alkalisoli]ODR88518.1 shikimate dehydrogenase [Sinorhizobium alkalisoli]